MLHPLELLFILTVYAPLADVRVGDARDLPTTRTDPQGRVGRVLPLDPADHNAAVLVVSVPHGLLQREDRRVEAAQLFVDC